MKKSLLLICFNFLIFSSWAQNDVNALVEFEEAEKAFNETKFDETLTRLNTAEKNLGKWTPKTSYLRILALDQLSDYN